MQLCVGRLVRGHGVRGALLVDVRTDDPDERFAVGVTLLTDPPERGPLAITGTQRVGGKLVISVQGVADRDTADALRGTLLLIGSDELAGLPGEDDFHDHELLGLQARTVDGTELGAVTDVLHGTGPDTLVVSGRGREVLVPFVRTIVPSVQVADGLLVIDPPEGLLDLN